VGLQQVGPLPFQPAQVVLADARAQVQQDRRDVFGAGVETGPRQPPQLPLPVAHAGQDRRHQHRRPKAGLGQGADGGQPPAGRRGAGLGDAGELVFVGADRHRHADLGVLGGGGEQVEVAHDHGRLGQDRERVSVLGQHLDQAAGELVAALGRLVGIGVGAHRDRLAAPSRVVQLAGQPLDRVHLDHDPALEVLARVQPQVLMRRPREAIAAGVPAAAVGVDGVAERHPRRRRQRVDDPPRVDGHVLDARKVTLLRSEQGELGILTLPTHAGSLTNICSSVHPDRLIVC